MSYLKNSWYCGAWATELTGQPLGRTLLGQPIVFYRDSAGRPVALAGRCPHRFAPLSAGVVAGDNIACGYHGLQFAPDGRCVLNPNGAGQIPARGGIRSYPVKERNGVVWIWMGDPERIETGLLPDDGFLADPRFAVRTGYLKVNAHYQLPIDNLLDLSHGVFLHSKTLLAPSEDAADAPVAAMAGEIEHRAEMDGNVVHSAYRFPPMRPSGLRRRLVDHDMTCSISRMSWYPASNLYFDVRVWAGTVTENGPPILRLPNVHYIVPETETTAHYFVGIGRDVKIDDPVEDEHMIGLVMKAFLEEDEPMIRQCQEMMGTTDLMALKPWILESDRAAVLSRRILDRLIRTENAEAVAVAQPASAPGPG